MPLISPLMPVSQIDRVRLRVNHESSVCVDIYGVCVCVCVAAWFMLCMESGQ